MQEQRPITISDVRETVHDVLEEREPRIRERVREQLEARDELLEAKLETLSARLSADIAAQIGVLFRNGPVTRIESGLQSVREALDRIDSDGCKAHYSRHPQEGTQSGQLPKLRDPKTWGEYLRSIPPWGWALALLAVPALGPEALANVVEVVKAVVGVP